jgi:glycosyltransferase involved in cell wall biosynthesis
MNVVAIIPALDEAEAIGPLVTAVMPHVTRVIVVDNGSTDATADVAHDAGATVVNEARRGYGAACMAGVEATPDATVYVFLDGDGADPPEHIPALLRALAAQPDGIVLGIRRGDVRPGAMLWHQRLGNLGMAWLMRRLYGWPVHDLASFKVIGALTLRRLDVQDRAQGWTAELLARCASNRLPLTEIATGYRKRPGKSKVSGSVRGSLRAAWQLNAAIVRVWRNGRRRARRTTAEDLTTSR